MTLQGFETSALKPSLTTDSSQHQSIGAVVGKSSKSLRCAKLAGKQVGWKTLNLIFPVSPRPICGIIRYIPFMWSHYATHISPRSRHGQSSTPYNRVIKCAFVAWNIPWLVAQTKSVVLHNQALPRLEAHLPWLHTGNLLALVGYMYSSFDPLLLVQLCGCLLTACMIFIATNLKSLGG